MLKRGFDASKSERNKSSNIITKSRRYQPLHMLIGQMLANRDASRLQTVLASFVLLACYTLTSKASALPLKWIGQDYSRKTLVHTGGNWTGDCRLNNVNTTVELKHRYVKNFGAQVKQDGQNFTLYNLDVRWSGDVSCHAPGTPIPDRLLTFLDVKHVPANYVMKIEIIPKIITELDYLDNIKITCRSQYEGRLRWLIFDGTEISSDKSGRIFQEYEPKTGARIQDRFEYANLTMTEVKPDDSGKYYCKKTDPFNSSKKAGINILVKASPPSFHSTFNLSMVNTGEDASLQCNAEGSPKPKVTWFDNEDRRLAWCTGGQHNQCEVDATYKSHYDIINRTLIIKNASYIHDHGYYRCVAKNMFGQDDRTVFLRVWVKPKMKKSQNFYGCSVKPGEKCRLTCEVEYSVPQPSITWEYQPPTCTNMSQFLTCDPNPSMWRTLPKDVGQFNFTLDRFGQNSYKSILTVSSNLQFGFFRCIAMNVLGEDRHMYRMKRNDITTLVTNNDISSQEWALYVVSAISCLLVVMLLIAVLKLYRNKKRYGRFVIVDDPIERLDPERPLIEQTAKLWYDNEWEFPSRGIHLDHQLGSGEFGEVFLAEATGVIVPDSKGRLRLKYIRSGTHDLKISSNGYQSYASAKVAVKKLKQDASEIDYKFLVSELKILIHIGWHPNVVNLLGACTKVNADRGIDVLVIMEYCSNGNMLDFLRIHSKIFSSVWTTPSDDPDAQLTSIDLVTWAHQVAQAMQFLASRKCIHRDLAARNVLIGNNFTVKVADFGLARDVYKTTHYTATTSRVPFKWTALEALQDGIFTSKSDVWSFGVLLWEMFTLGGEPYAFLPTAHEILDFLLRGERMEQPSNCPSEIYTIMKECWEKNPSKRLAFAQLVERIGDFKDSKGLDNETIIESKLQQLTSETGDKRGKEQISLAFKNPSKNMEAGLLSLKPVNKNKNRTFVANEDLRFVNQLYENLDEEHRKISEFV